MEAEVCTMRVINVLFVRQLLSEALPNHSARRAHLLHRMRVQSSALWNSMLCCLHVLVRYQDAMLSKRFGSVLHSELYASVIGVPFPNIMLSRIFAQTVWLL